MWFKILYFAVKRNGWPALFFYLSNLDIWRFSKARQYISPGNTPSPGNTAGKILDLGAGYSIFPSFFPGRDYTAVDLGQGACAYQRLHHTRAVVADITRVPFETASASLIVAISSIEHVPNDRGVFKEIGRLLADEGIAVVSVPFSNGASRIVPLRHPKWQMGLLKRFFKIWNVILGEIHTGYFAEQISTDSTIKYYSLSELQDILNDSRLIIFRIYPVCIKARPGRLPGVASRLVHIEGPHHRPGPVSHREADPPPQY
jgi:SAM-dependent methyltransferase